MDNGHEEEQTPFFDLNEPFDESDDDDNDQQQNDQHHESNNEQFARHSVITSVMNYYTVAPTSEINHDRNSGGEIQCKPKRSRIRMDHTGDNSDSDNNDASTSADTNAERRKRSRSYSRSPSLSSSSSSSASHTHTLAHNSNNRVDRHIHEPNGFEARFAQAHRHEQRDRQNAVTKYNAGVDYVFKKVLGALESRRYHFSFVQKAEALERARDYVNREMRNDDKVRIYCSNIVTLMHRGSVEKAISLARELDVEGYIIPPSAFKCLLLGLSYHRRIEMGQVWFDKLIHGHKHKPTQDIMEVFLFGFMRVGYFEETERRMISLNKEFGSYETGH